MHKIQKEYLEVHYGRSLEGFKEHYLLSTRTTTKTINWKNTKVNHGSSLAHGFCVASFNTKATTNVDSLDSLLQTIHLL